ncbi:hypothetical protein AB0C02_30480 [Micromonospora sp. NPDC048999]|uniref:hypothetical protein n=1 Tax=Micromonospora sp. NPDC048999 TaxID=3155391 RepID=UPI00340C45FF
MAEPTQDQDKPNPTEVTISTPGVSVTIKSHAPLGAVTSTAERVHEAAVRRYANGRLPDGHGGIL